MPSELEAFEQLQRLMAPRHVQRDFSKLHPTVYAAFKKLDWPVLSTEPSKLQRKAFSEAWAAVQRDVAAGRSLPSWTPPERQIAPAPTMHQRRVNPEAVLDSLKSMFTEEERTA
jgi:hypothetical protein